MTESNRVRILHVPDCPLVDRLRAEVKACLGEVAPSYVVELVEGDHPSPTLLVDGIDVATGAPVSGEARCRLDLPSPEQVREALSALG